MSDVEKSAFEAGVMSALAAIAAALKSSPEFNNEALVNIAQHETVRNFVFGHNM
ncbi:hypothetical protein [Pseudomonas amygdali]